VLYRPRYTVSFRPMFASEFGVAVSNVVPTSHLEMLQMRGMFRFRARLSRGNSAFRTAISEPAVACRRPQQMSELPHGN